METRHQTPYIMEERVMNITQMDIFSRLMIDRIIFIGGGINSDTCNIVTSQLMYLSSISKDPIKIYINSPGGSVIDGGSILDGMDLAKKKGIIIETCAIGMCASMGALILCNGTRGYRKSTPRSWIMIHETSGGVEGKSSDILVQVQHMQRVEKHLFETLSENTDKSIEDLRNLCQKDFWMTPQEAIDINLIDAILK